MDVFPGMDNSFFTFLCTFSFASVVGQRRCSVCSWLSSSLFCCCVFALHLLLLFACCSLLFTIRIFLLILGKIFFHSFTIRTELTVNKENLHCVPNIQIIFHFHLASPNICFKILLSYAPCSQLEYVMAYLVHKNVLAISNYIFFVRNSLSTYSLTAAFALLSFVR